MSPGLKDTKARVFALIAAGVFVSVAYLLFFRNEAGPFDQQKLESVVEEIRSMDLMPGEDREFMLSNLDDPKSLRPLTPRTYIPRGQDAGHVWAMLSEDGNLKVVFSTRESGRAEYGFAYFDKVGEPTPDENDPHCLYLDTPGPLSETASRLRINAHWWGVRCID